MERFHIQGIYQIFISGHSIGYIKCTPEYAAGIEDTKVGRRLIQRGPLSKVIAY